MSRRPEVVLVEDDAREAELVVSALGPGVHVTTVADGAAAPVVPVTWPNATADHDIVARAIAMTRRFPFIGHFPGW